MIADWTRGDVEAIAKMENDEMKSKQPELYQKLLVDRNQHFSNQIAAMLKDPGPSPATAFIAVGAAHLAGPDSVLALLQKQGFQATRVQ
jgi:uncharacterized protein YbaP (TraB family)